MEKLWKEDSWKISRHRKKPSQNILKLHKKAIRPPKTPPKQPQIKITLKSRPPHKLKPSPDISYASLKTTTTTKPNIHNAWNNFIWIIKINKESIENNKRNEIIYREYKNNWRCNKRWRTFIQILSVFGWLWQVG